LLIGFYLNCCSRFFVAFLPVLIGLGITKNFYKLWPVGTWWNFPRGFPESVANFHIFLLAQKVRQFIERDSCQIEMGCRRHIWITCIGGHRHRSQCFWYPISNIDICYSDIRDNMLDWKTSFRYRKCSVKDRTSTTFSTLGPFSSKFSEAYIHFLGV
jgi:hypothetical protein